jgi:hypothetical protein
MAVEPEFNEIARLKHALRILDMIVQDSARLLGSGTTNRRARAVADIIPGAANISIALHNLLEARLLSPAEILLRALLDRIGTMSYMRVKGQSAIEHWEKGWPKKGQPTFEQKLATLPDEIYPHSMSDDPSKRVTTQRMKSEIIRLLKSLHGSVHGDLASTYNTVVSEDGENSIHVIGPDYKNVSYFSTLISMAAILTMLLVFEIESAFAEGIPEYIR